MKIKNTNKGITLIALVITIIVMLILVAVTITMAVNGGLFEYAGNAGTQTNEKKDAEQEFANLQPDMTYDDLIEKYIEWKEDGVQGGTENNGQGSVEEITFSIDGTNYTVTKGWTWFEFEESEYHGFESCGSYASKGDYYVCHEDGTKVLWEADLINGHSYQLIHM